MQKIYAEDRAKIAANHATEGERRDWNKRVEREKNERAFENARTFVPRKSSHKRAYRLAKFAHLTPRTTGLQH